MKRYHLNLNLTGVVVLLAVGVLLPVMLSTAVGIVALVIARDAGGIVTGLLVIGMMLPFIVDISLSGSAPSGEAGFAGAVRWLSTGSHIDRMLQGLIDTSDLAYYAITSAGFLLLAKTVIESARWR